MRSRTTIDLILEFLAASIFCCTFAESIAYADAARQSGSHIPVQPIDLTRKLSKFEVKNEDLLHTVRWLAFDGIPVGLIVGKWPPPLSININMKDAQVKEILDAITTHVPEYIWTVSGGIVHLEPRDSQKRSELTVLQQPITNFSSRDFNITTTIGLLNLYARSQGLPVFAIETSSTVLRDNAEQTSEDARISIRVELPSKLIDVLDAIVLKDSPGFWVAYPCRHRICIMGDSTHKHLKPSMDEQRKEDLRKSITGEKTPSLP